MASQTDEAFPESDEAIAKATIIHQQLVDTGIDPVQSTIMEDIVIDLFHQNMIVIDAGHVLTHRTFIALMITIVDGEKIAPNVSDRMIGNDLGMDPMV